MIALAWAWCRYTWHRRVLRHDTRALIFLRRYTHLSCNTCGAFFWQMPGLFTRR